MLSVITARTRTGIISRFLIWGGYPGFVFGGRTRKGTPFAEPKKPSKLKEFIKGICFFLRPVGLGFSGDRV